MLDKLLADGFRKKFVKMLKFSIGLDGKLNKDAITKKNGLLEVTKYPNCKDCISCLQSFKYYRNVNVLINVQQDTSGVKITLTEKREFGFYCFYYFRNFKNDTKLKK